MRPHSFPRTWAFIRSSSDWVGRLTAGDLTEMGSTVTGLAEGGLTDCFDFVGVPFTAMASLRFPLTAPFLLFSVTTTSSSRFWKDFFGVLLGVRLSKTALSFFDDFCFEGVCLAFFDGVTGIRDEVRKWEVSDRTGERDLSLDLFFPFDTAPFEVFPFP